MIKINNIPKINPKQNPTISAIVGFINLSNSLFNMVDLRLCYTIQLF